MGKGYLKVKAYESNAVLPLAKVAVIISDENHQKIDMALTNESGQTKTFELDAPSKEISLDEDSSLPAFRTVNIYLYKEGYYIIRIENAQIFDTVTSFESAQMIPLPQNETVQDKIIVIPPQNLGGREKENG